ncbi:MAG: hypothetical protein R3E50_10790 [Halioglobus sp.]
MCGLVALGQRQRADQHEGHIEMRDLNEKYRNMGAAIRYVIDDPDDLKAQKKADKKQEKARAKAAKKKLGKGAAPRAKTGAGACSC